MSMKQIQGNCFFGLQNNWHWLIIILSVALSVTAQHDMRWYMSVHMFMEHMKTMRHRLQHKLLYIELKLPEYFWTQVSRLKILGIKHKDLCFSQKIRGRRKWYILLRKAVQLTESSTQKAFHHNNKQYIQQKLAPCHPGGRNRWLLCACSRWVRPPLYNATVRYTVPSNSLKQQKLIIRSLFFHTYRSNE